MIRLKTEKQKKTHIKSNNIKTYIFYFSKLIYINDPNQ